MNNEEKEKAMLADDLTVYIKDKHTSDEVVGFIDGYEAALNKFKELGLGCVIGQSEQLKVMFDRHEKETGHFTMCLDEILEYKKNL